MSAGGTISPISACPTEGLTGTISPISACLTEGLTGTSESSSGTSESSSSEPRSFTRDSHNSSDATENKSPEAALKLKNGFAELGPCLPPEMCQSLCNYFNDQLGTPDSRHTVGNGNRALLIVHPSTTKDERMLNFIALVIHSLRTYCEVSSG